MAFEHSGITGKIVERELFGETRQEKHETVPKVCYRSYEESIIFAKQRQPFDSTDPAPDFANAVHFLVAERLGVDVEQLHFYTAINTPLDRFHGVDGWFELVSEQGRLQVTVDLTTNPNKEDHKADVVFLVPHDGLDRKVDKKQYMEYTDSLTDEIVRKFNHGR